MVTVLIGLGPNRVKVPCLIFPDMETGKTYMENHSEFVARVKQTDTGIYYRVRAEKVDIWEGHQLQVAQNGQVQDPPKAFFTSYYGGCGECLSFLLKEVEFGKPFVPFDLD